MNFLGDLRSALSELVIDTEGPIVVYSASWPIMREMRRTDPGVIDEILDVIVGVAAGRSLLFPTFTGGYRDGICNLDTEPSATGMLTEAFRTLPGGIRTYSAFFSFKVIGQAEGELRELMAEDAWGDGSLYDWMEKRNARQLMVGTHPTHSSYFHRLEWLARDVIPYRYVKTFDGTLIRDGVPRTATERLYVRSLEPEVHNDFTGLVEPLEASGMLRNTINGVSVSAFDTLAARDVLMPMVLRDPLMLIANRKDFEK